MLRRWLHVSRSFQSSEIIVTRKITRQDVDEFSRVSGDTNPIHAGENGIVHGAFLNALVSSVIGTKLPGHGSIVVAQTLRFPSSCQVNDVVTIKVELISSRKLFWVQYKCTARERVVLEGDAKLVPPPSSK